MALRAGTTLRAVATLTLWPAGSLWAIATLALRPTGGLTLRARLIAVCRAIALTLTLTLRATRMSRAASWRAVAAGGAA